MSLESENISPEITFSNEPTLSMHEIDATSNEKRLQLIPEIKNFIAQHELFKNKEVTITFSETGVSSLVSIIETPDQKLVLKIPLAKQASEGEATFLRAWEENGVTVPHVIEEGKLQDQPYLLMDFVDARSLSQEQTYTELVKNNIFTEMGHTLRKMHTPQSEGYGRILNNLPEYNEFSEWINSTDIQSKISYIQETAIFNGCGSITEAQKTLLNFINNSNSTYCHTDFAIYNIFATEPLTVFDPDPGLNNGYIDVGRSIVIAVAQGNKPEAATQLIKGYFSEESHDKDVLRASILLNSYIKSKRWYRMKKTKRIDNLRNYLLQS